MNESLLGQNREDSPVEIEEKVEKRYRKILLIRVIGSFFLIFAMILERIFSSYTRQYENAFVDALQESLGIHEYKDVPKFFLYLHQFKYVGVLLAHLYFTLFFGFNALIAFKCLLIHFNTLVIVANLEVMFSEPRPFWDSEGIIGAVCDPSYAFPSYSVFAVAFFFWYSSHCWDTEDDEGTTHCCQNIKIIIFICLIVLYAFSCLLMGLNYPSQIILALLYSVVCFFIVNFFDKTINDLVMKTSIQVDSAKKYSIYWLIYLILVATLSAVVYASADTFVEIKWLKNFFVCLAQRNPNEYDQKSYYHLLGPWASFVRTTIIFAMGGAIFGTARTFRVMNGVSWFQEKRLHKLAMVSIANLTLLPLWVLSFYEDKFLPGLSQIGINEYLYNAILFGSLYYVVFGVLPTTLFLKLNLINNDAGYVVPPEIDFRSETFAPTKLHDENEVSFL